MRWHMLPVVFLALAACGTPQEQCIRSNTRDLRTVDRLIAETERNLDRGYALETRTVWRNEMVPCYGPPRTPGGRPVARMCWDERPVDVTRPRAINLDAEADKLASLKKKRVSLARQAESVVAQCQRIYPETTQ